MPLPSDSEYRTIRGLGRGGIAETFLATCPMGPGQPARLAALKQIWPDLVEDPDFLAMFLDEARLPLHLRHRNIVETLEVGQSGGRYFIATEFVAGPTLGQVLERLDDGDKFALSHRLDILIDVLAALEHAHQRSGSDPSLLPIVVHRNINPNNVFVGFDGTVKLADFGIGKAQLRSHEKRQPPLQHRFAYAAPEQVREATCDRRADLFAVGLLLWELLAFRPLLRGKTEAEIVPLLCGGEPLPAPPAEVVLPEQLRRISARALALDPGERYQTAREFADDLRAAVADLGDYPADLLSDVVSQAFQAEKQALEAETAALAETVATPAVADLVVAPPLAHITSAPAGESSSAPTIRSTSPAAPRTAARPTPKATPTAVAALAGWLSPRRRLAVVCTMAGGGLLGIFLLARAVRRPARGNETAQRTHAAALPIAPARPVPATMPPTIPATMAPAPPPRPFPAGDPAPERALRPRPAQKPPAATTPRPGPRRPARRIDTSNPYLP